MYNEDLKYLDEEYRKLAKEIFLYHYGIKPFLNGYCVNSVFTCLLKNKKITPGEIAKELNLKSNRLSNLLKNLKDNEYIELVSSSTDKRKKYIIPTKKGIEKHMEIEEFNKKRCEFLLNTIGIEKFKEFFKLHKEITLADKEFCKKEGKNV